MTRPWDVKFGPARAQAIRDHLSYPGNVIAGYRLYLAAWFDLAYGKYYTEPGDADRGIQWLVEQGYLEPTRFAVEPERRIAVGTIGYNRAYLKSLERAPVAGHYVDWDHRVVRLD